MTAPKAFAGLSRPQRKGNPSSGLVRVKRDMARKRTSPGGPACRGKGAGLDAAWTTTRAPRAVLLETTFPRATRAERAGKRAFRVQCAGAKAIFGYIREVQEAIRPFASAALGVWCFCWLQSGFIRYCPARKFPFCVCEWKLHVLRWRPLVLPSLLCAVVSAASPNLLLVASPSLTPNRP